MNDRDIIAKYMQLAEFLYMCLGRNIEIVVHDLTDPDHSVVAIHNNDISRRGIGAPLTDFAINIIRDKVYETKPFIVNYTGKSQDGLQLRSSTYFIKNQKDKLIGLLCLNIDVTRHKRLLEEMQSLIRGEQPDSLEESEGTGANNSSYQETFPSSVSNMIEIIATQRMNGVPAARLTTEEKIDIVKELNGQGVFMLKGSIPAAAEKLGISEATVYRYLSKLKRLKGDNGD